MQKEELKSLASVVSRLSALLTKDRENLPVAYLKDPELRNAYIRYFLPANMKKVHLPLTDLSLNPASLPGARLRVLDLGCGPGTALLGVLSFFAQRPQRPSLACVAVDRVGENLRAAEDVFNSYTNSNSLDASIKTVRADIGTEYAVEGLFDLILFSNVLNELYPFDEDRIERRASLVKAVMTRHLADTGSCIIIEPALRTTSREMLEIRDNILGQGAHIYSPCLAHGKCPALANPRDWCHEDIAWDPPAVIKEIDSLTGLRKDSLKFSYLVLRKDRLSLADILGHHSFRVVSEPLVSKGKLEIFICGAPGRKLVTRLDKDKSPENQFFDVLKRGAIAGFAGLIDEGTRFKIEQGTKVIIHRHAT